MILNFRLWLLLHENFDPAAYDDLFNKELDAVLPTLRNPEERKRLAAMRGMAWTNYIAAALRNGGFREQGQLEELIHDVVVKLLVSPGGLFRGYDERRHGSLDLRFKRSVSNAVKNVAEKEKNRRKYLPGGIGVEDLPARSEPNHDSKLVERFRAKLQSRLGDLAVKIFDARLEGRQMKDLIGLPELGRSGRFVVKRTVQEIKTLAHEFAEVLGDADFLWQVERLMDAEAATIARRTATTRRRAMAHNTT
ncbi:MAG: hypothetical protein ACLP9L_07705 [Thermoguttaceae bacterium]